MTEHPIYGYHCPIFQDVCFRPGRLDAEHQIEAQHTIVNSTEQAPMQMLLLPRWVADRLGKWLDPSNGYRGDLTITMSAPGQIGLIRETRRILASEMAETGWQNVDYGAVRMTFQCGVPHVLEEERTIKPPKEE
jgi:hypothetical protein